MASTPIVDNIVGIGGMTRNDHIFSPQDLRKEENHWEKQRNQEVIIEKTKKFLKGKALQAKEEPRMKR